MSSLFAQVNLKFENTYGGVENDVGYAIEKTNDGGFIIVGTTFSFGAGHSDVYAIKTDENGNVMWTKTYGGTSWDYGEDVKQTFDGGYIILGTTASPVASGWYFYFIKTDANGDTLWTKVYHRADSYANKIIQTSDSGYIAVGSSHYFFIPFDNIWKDYIIKTDENGDTLWTKSYFGGEYLTDNSHKGASAQDVLETSDSTFLILGLHADTTITAKPYLLELDQNGDSLSSTYYDHGFLVSLEHTFDNNYIACGYKQVDSTDYDGWVIKFDQTGDLLWSNTIGNSENEHLLNVSQNTIYNEYIFTGGLNIYDSTAALYVLNTDMYGDSLWSYSLNYDGYEVGKDIETLPDGDFIITGYTNSIGEGGYDVLLLKIGFELSVNNDDLYLPDQTRLFQPYPNPFNPTTNIRFNIGVETQHATSLQIYDLTGRLVETLINESLTPGEHEISWNAGQLPSGVYFVRLQTGEFVENQKILLLK